MNEITMSSLETLPQPLALTTEAISVDARFAIEAASRFGSFAMYDVGEYQTLRRVNQELTDTALLRGVERSKIYEINCDMNNATTSFVRSETESVKRFMYQSKDSGIVLINDLDRLVGAKQPNAAQDLAYSNIIEILKDDRAHAPICAVSRFDQAELDKHTRKNELIGAFALSKAYTGGSDIEATLTVDETAEPAARQLVAV